MLNYPTEIDSEFEILKEVKNYFRNSEIYHRPQLLRGINPNTGKNSYYELTDILVVKDQDVILFEIKSKKNNIKWKYMSDQYKKGIRQLNHAEEFIRKNNFFYTYNQDKIHLKNIKNIYKIVIMFGVDKFTLRKDRFDVRVGKYRTKYPGIATSNQIKHSGFCYYYGNNQNCHVLTYQQFKYLIGKIDEHNFKSYFSWKDINIRGKINNTKEQVLVLSYILNIYDKNILENVIDPIIEKLESLINSQKSIEIN